MSTDRPADARTTGLLAVDHERFVAVDPLADPRAMVCGSYRRRYPAVGPSREVGIGMSTTHDVPVRDQERPIAVLDDEASGRRERALLVDQRQEQAGPAEAI